VENNEMTRQRVGFPNRIRAAVTVATVVAMSLGLVAPALAADAATFSGAVMAPDNSFAQGFTVVFKDVASGQEFRSGPTSATGEYQVSVPTGARYKLDSVVAPDGTKLPVQNVPPIPVRVAGASKLDVKFANAPAVAGAPAGAAPAAAGTAVAATASAAKTPAPAATSPAAKPASAPPPQTSVASTTPAASDDKKKKDKGAVPWWKKPGPIVGMVLGGAAIVALAVGGGGSDNPASQSNP
jgi:hypothetical protein